MGDLAKCQHAIWCHGWIFLARIRFDLGNLSTYSKDAHDLLSNGLPSIRVPAIKNAEFFFSSSLAEAITITPPTLLQRLRN